MKAWNFLVVTAVVLCCVIGDVELHSDSFQSSFRAGRFSSRSQDEDALLDEEHNMEGENRIITMLAQIIRDMRMKYAPDPIYYDSFPEPNIRPTPSAFFPDFTYQFPQIDLSSFDFSSIPFAVKPNEPQFYQTDISSNSKKQIVGFANEDPSPEVARGSKSQAPKLKMSPPVIILVKHGEGIAEMKDNNNRHPAHPHLQSHPGKLHKGRPNGGADDPERQQDSHVFITREDSFDEDNMYFIALVAGCSAALLLVIAVGVYSWYKLQRNSKLGADVKYPAYSVGGVTKNGTPPSSGDRRLAHSAQMYHYQHQKQQILALENNTRDQRRGSISDADSDDEHDADHTVYECPTLPLTNKKTPDIEVKKPTVETKPAPSLPSSNTSEEYSQHSETK